MRVRWRSVGGLIVGTVLTSGCLRHRAARGVGGPAFGRVTALEASRHEPHAYGTRGDLVLHGTQRATVLVAGGADLPGHRPVRGALLDLSPDDIERSDPMLWWRAGWLDAALRFHPLVATSVVPTACANRGAGIAAEGVVDGVSLSRTVCARGDGGFDVTSRARSALPAGAHLVDELAPGTAVPVLETPEVLNGSSATEQSQTRFVVLAERGMAVVIDGEGPFTVRRRVVQIAAETFRAPMQIQGEGDTLHQVMHILAGDALDALSSMASPARDVSVSFDDDSWGTLELQDAEGHRLANGVITAGERHRTLHIPVGFGTQLVARDAHGSQTPAFVLPTDAQGRLVASFVRPPPGVVHFDVRDAFGVGLPVHVLFRGLDGTADPIPASGPMAYAAGRSVYLVDGARDVSLPPGHYRVSVSHGPRYALSVGDVTLRPGGQASVQTTLPLVVTAAGWTSADLHLHAAPSPDSDVSLPERIVALVCEDVQWAVATDHNRITDYAPVVATLGLTGRLATTRGDEITSDGTMPWGHFNAFPFADREGAPEAQVPPYFDRTPSQMFAAARAQGAEVIQVNHPRMPPRIGYFDQAGFDARTGTAGPSFAEGFDAVEAFNGMWIETPARVREGVHDGVGLARRGVRVALTGNSDSHHLLFEEAGYPRTYVHVDPEPIATRAERALAALRAGATTVSSGPFVEMTVNGALPGAVLQTSTAQVHVRVSAPAWVPLERVEVWLNDQVAAAWRVTAPVLDGMRAAEYDVTIPIAADATLLAWADADAPLPDVLPYAHARAIGFTGFVYIDADGDGAVRVPRAGEPHAR